ncbi:MAG: cytidylate kinase-like family protein [Butyrivibrio sp.]|nr:cytidylate kinase-like family protein [Butyrivibrio sp.]
MDNNYVITIGREYGSAGRQIGMALAAELGIKCYDKELLALAAKDSGLTEELFHTHDEKPTNSFLYSLVMDTYSMGYSTPSFIDMPLNQRVFMAQHDSIKKLADSESCIIVGRCADYALKNHPGCISVFIKADMDAKIKRIMRIYGYNENKARDLIVKTDKKRANYYNFYSNKKWGDSRSYDLCIDSSKLGIDGTVAMLKEYVKQRIETGVKEI